MAQLNIEVYRPVGEFVWEYQGKLGQYEPEVIFLNVLHDGRRESHIVGVEPNGLSSIVTTSRRAKSFSAVELRDGEAKIIFQRSPGDFMPTALRLTHRRTSPHVWLTASGIKTVT